VAQLQRAVRAISETGIGMPQEILPTLTPREARALLKVAQLFALDPEMYRRLTGLGLIERKFGRWALTDVGKLKLSDTASTADEV
jgi:hypothetical protein